MPLCAAAGLRHGGTWGANDDIIFPDYGGLWHVSGNGGKPELLVATDAAASWPDFLPDGNAVLFTTMGPERFLRRDVRLPALPLWCHTRYFGFPSNKCRRELGRHVEKVNRASVL